jgi:HK97 family phage prohead protease
VTLFVEVPSVSYPVAAHRYRWFGCTRLMTRARYVGDVVEATETDHGLAIKGRFDLDAEFGKSAYRNTKGRRVSGLSIGYAIRNSTKTASGN